MRAIWTIFCNHCARYTTVGKPPKSSEFVASLTCAVCDKPIDANNGRFSFPNRAPRVQNDAVEENLLGVE